MLTLSSSPGWEEKPTTPNREVDNPETPSLELKRYQRNNAQGILDLLRKSNQRGGNNKPEKNNN